MARFIYKGCKTNQISFPLGGIGTGSIGLAGNGRLIDWDIMNRPSKGSINGYTHFAIKAEQNGKVVDTRILNGDLPPPYIGEFSIPGWLGSNFGFGPTRSQMAGAPHFKEVEFRGEFPIADLSFRGAAFPGRVRMTAFNPFIPLNDKDSGIPAAFFEIRVKNTSKKPTTYTVACTLHNPLDAPNINTLHMTKRASMLYLTSDAHGKDSIKYADLTAATDSPVTSGQQYWFTCGMSWFDSLEVYWRDLTRPGKFRNRRFSKKDAGSDTNGIVAAHVKVAPGATGKIRFVIAWNVPNCENDWGLDENLLAKKKISRTWKNYYAALWRDSKASAQYALENWDRLYRETLLFKNALYASDLPAAALNAVSANISVLKTATVRRLEDGTFYGWEGCCSSSGCCDGSCTHVWNYAQALPFLFPKLERSMRTAHYKHDLDPYGGLRFRTQLPLGIGYSGFRPCADGQYGDVMKVYRDWKICGDDGWLRSLWPRIKKSIAYAWHEKNPDQWDPQKTGVLCGRQHHTLDRELFGPNAWLTGYYLGGLKAAAEMAAHFGEDDLAAEYARIFRQGKTWVNKRLFNGEYYYQRVNLKDKSIVERFDAMDYWNDEHRELKHQIGEGCEIDQTIAQWHANLYGLGEIFERKQARKALKSLFKYNFRPKVREYFNACRIYALNDEAGLVICHWPEHAYRPMVPLPYAGETQNGYEWAACIQMIQGGLIKEGMRCVEAIRERYDGEKRNPWNEFECGSNYARSMASYSLLNAFSGFEFDMVHGMIGFAPPQLRKGCFRAFWSLDSGWGEFLMDRKGAELKVLSGFLTVKVFKVPPGMKVKKGVLTLGGRNIAFRKSGRKLVFAEPVTIDRGKSLRFR